MSTGPFPPGSSTARSIVRWTALLGTAVLHGACTDAAGPGTRGSLALELVADGLSAPLYATAPPGEEHRLFVVEQTGAIRIVKEGQLLSTPFLDLGGLVGTGGERGLLSMAFHPAYAQNGYFYVDYTDLAGDTRVARYSTSADPDVADAGSALPILSVDQPYANHNGGLLAFGPDGDLYVGLGDGGGAGDPDGNGPDPATLLGTILRLDVDGGSPYSVPADNPFVGDPDARPEVWAYGLRNPWRFSFDRVTGDLYIGDVGQNDWEEVSLHVAGTPSGENFGWSTLEGSHCYRPSTGCSTSGLVLPIHEYSHQEGCSIVGGYRYRGTAVAELAGRYLFADLCGGWIRSFTVEGGAAVDVRDHTAALGTVSSPVSFAEDADGELYVVSLDGAVYRITVRP